MRKSRILAGGAAATLAVAGAFAFNTSASAQTLDADIADARADLVGNVDTELLGAMTEHFGISEGAALDRLALESVASDLTSELSAEAGFAGLWVNADGTEINVATTEGSELSTPGVNEVPVKYDLATLDRVIGVLDDHAGVKGEEGVYGWYVDVMNNEVVVEAASTEAGEAFAEAAGVNTDLVSYNTDVEAPETFIVRGGDSYSTNVGTCSVGFGVYHGSTPGFVTAGHCGSQGAAVTRGNAAPGTFQQSVFPGNDAAWVSVSAGKNVTGTVNTYWGTRAVHNANEAAIGASICRSGQTTGWHCGTIQAKNQSVSYPQGTVHGMTQTSVCAEPGDSGGAYITGNSAQGVTSGGSGNCSWGGTTYYQPILPMLNAWNLTLATA
ncbi:S1 family peptidase [Natronoglycomyces albus]|uniref:S1 family peptidase n=1 Tax=Natronoglycomyces albus TaxID=2811108 RepID=A0A895XWB1_9ACTN|nr:S1 family peptidase [Natronoglycomyces albus]QSB05918.1 S1 family peptidase [Natronoglycomyces albus]